ncbi:MAG TPA: hypothetical protein VFU02_10640 [Polyangiaceae bacterium]|nr:hypothetical protein [Polyangiaceae bacterium]
MPRPLLPLLAALAVVLAGLYPRFVSAQQGDAVTSEPTQEKVRLVYRGPEECPDAGAFRTVVARRLGGDWEAAPGELARRIEIVVARTQDGYVATIGLLNAEGQQLRRAVRGRDCKDVVNGIGLVTALAIEARVDEAFDRSEPVQAPAPTSSSTPGGAPAGAPAAAAKPAGVASAAVQPGAAPAAQPRGAPPVATQPGAAPPAATQPGAAPPAAAPAAPVAATPAAPLQQDSPDENGVPLQWRAGVRGGFATGIAPRLAPGLGVAGMLERGDARFGLSVFAFSSGRVTEAGVEARFDLVTSRLEACPIAFDLGGSIALEPCASFEAGVLSGRGYSDPPTVAEGHSGRSPWWAPGVLGRMVVSFGQLVVELEGSARFPLRREEFYVDPEGEGTAGSTITVHEVPATSFGAALGVGLRF